MITDEKAKTTRLIITLGQSSPENCEFGAAGVCTA